MSSAEEPSPLGSDDETGKGKRSPRPGEPCGEHMSRAYGQLRVLASKYLRKEPRNHTLQPTALVHEVYMRLERSGIPPELSDDAFLALASRCIRNVLVDHARARNSVKRGGGWVRVTLEEGLVAGSAGTINLLALDEAMGGLERWNERLARIVELRFFCGLSNAEAASALGLTPPACEHEWRLAKAWLRRELSRGR